MKRTWKTTAVGAAAGALLLALLAPTAASAAKPPAGKTYFVVSIGVATEAAEAYEEAAGCVSFTSTEICNETACGTWSRIDDAEKGKRQESIEFEFVLTDDETGEPIEIVGRADVDGRGRRSSIGGAATGVEPASGRTINLALGGRAVGAARCAQLVEDFASGN